MSDLPNPLRAITLHPWWAWDIMNGTKTIEYRSKPLPKSIVGQIVALHAGAAPEMDRGSLRWSDRALDAEILGAPVNLWAREGFSVSDRCTVHGSAVVGLVVFTETVPSADLPMMWRTREFVGWRIGKVVRLPRPILGPGAQGWWKVSDECRAAIAAQMEAPWVTCARSTTR